MRSIVAILTALAFMLLACSGDSDDPGSINAGEAKEAADEFILTSFHLFTGDSSPQEFIDLFAPECRDDVDESEIALALTLIRAFASEFQDLDIDKVDVGRVTVEYVAEGALVNLPDPGGVRVEVDGDFKLLSELFTDLGLDFEIGPGELENLLLVRRDGEIHLGDCAELSDFGGID